MPLASTPMLARGRVLLLTGEMEVTFVLPRIVKMERYTWNVAIIVEGNVVRILWKTNAIPSVCPVVIAQKIDCGTDKGVCPKSNVHVSDKVRLKEMSIHKDQHSPRNVNHVCAALAACGTARRRLTVMVAA